MSGKAEWEREKQCAALNVNVLRSGVCCSRASLHTSQQSLLFTEQFDLRKKNANVNRVESVSVAHTTL